MSQLDLANLSGDDGDDPVNLDGHATRLLTLSQSNAGSGRTGVGAMFRRGESEGERSE